MADGRLIHTGNAIVDIALTIDTLPEPGGDVVASSSAVTAGGAVNALVAASRDGLEAVYAGALGTGPFGSLVGSALTEAGIGIAGPRIPDLDTGSSVVLVDASAERTFVTSVGAEAQLTREALDAVAVRSGDIVAVSGYSLAHPTNADALPGWLDSLPRGILVVFDPSPLVADLPVDVLERVLLRADVVTANAREARLLTGQAQPSAGATALRLRIAEDATVIVRDGADGCWIAAGAAPALHVAGFPVRAVDSTGAGDTHCGVLCAALALGAALPAAARRANAAAALAVERRGPATAPTSAEIEALLAR